LISLGCAKNLVDAEIILGSLAQQGMEITNALSLADVLVINTCSFIDAAKEESVDTVLEHAAVREAQGRGQAIVVAGCLTQRYQKQLPALMPEVDGFMGLDQVTQAPEIIRKAWARRRTQASGSRIAGTKVDLGSACGRLIEAKPVVVANARSTFIPDYATPRFRLTPPHLAYVKVAEGCNHPCSFCVIPRIRGSHRSRPQPDIVAECRRWVAEGVRELNLISQDTTYYGLDLRPERRGATASPVQFGAAVQNLPAQAVTLSTLLRELNAIPGDFWIRVLYTHPAHWTDLLMDTLAECSKVARYVDIPLQHIHPVMLERMRRETSSAFLVQLLAKIRQRIPGIAIRTTFITGFPGETESCFEELLDFIRQTRFERLGVFAYSPEEGTRAAKMAGQIPAHIRHQRRNRAMAEQLKIAREISASYVGKSLPVVVEREVHQDEPLAAEVRSWEHGLVRRIDQHVDLGQGRWFLGRGEADAPDIDGRVYVRGHVPIGKFIRVHVIGHTDYDLIAEPQLKQEHSAASPA
jgi:ribosomal protein S12 methylthiotransferase